MKKVRVMKYDANVRIGRCEKNRMEMGEAMNALVLLQLQVFFIRQNRLPYQRSVFCQKKTEVLKSTQNFTSVMRFDKTNKLFSSSFFSV